LPFTHGVDVGGIDGYGDGRRRRVECSISGKRPWAYSPGVPVLSISDPAPRSMDENAHDRNTPPRRNLQCCSHRDGRDTHNNSSLHYRTRCHVASWTAQGGSGGDCPRPLSLHSPTRSILFFRRPGVHASSPHTPGGCFRYLGAQPHFTPWRFSLVVAGHGGWLFGPQATTRLLHFLNHRARWFVRSTKTAVIAGGTSPRATSCHPPVASLFVSHTV
jgi:hypothetical protein